MKVPFYLIDAFSDQPFSGNPAGVCLLRDPMDEVWMQRVAAEINQAETAFVWPRGDRHVLRWFTPTVEVDLCGHATLGAAMALWTSGCSDDRLTFETHSGRLEVWREADGLLALDFPAERGMEHTERGETYDRVLAALGTAPEWLGRNRMDWLALLPQAQQVFDFKPSFETIAAAGMRGLIITAMDHAGKDYDYVCRFFAPQSGVGEDPVTGSAHCFLGPFWGDRLAKSRVRGFQASPRGGLVDVEMVMDRAILRGRGRVVVQGELIA